MPNTNGHGPKTAILYARVSTEEQAKKGYSIRQQLDRGRRWCEENGYEILAEVEDPGQGGATLERPGMDEIRDAVAKENPRISLVWAQDRDRFAREPAYLYLLREEFALHGCVLRSANDHGDGSPEGQLADGIMDQLARFERMKTAERTRRGKLQRAREGKVVPARRVNYGFRLNEDRTNYVVDEERMRVVRRAVHLAAEGAAVNGIKRILDAERVPAATGGPYWHCGTIESFITDDVYRPHTFEEIRELVTPQVAATLDPERLYGVWYYNRKRVKSTQISEAEPGGTGRVYRRRRSNSRKERSEWIAVPVPDAGIPLEVVEAARRTVQEYKTGSKAAGRSWQLSGGIARCGSCGRAMIAKPVTYKLKSGGTSIINYYKCCKVHAYSYRCSHGTSYRAEELEGRVWELVLSLLRDPERLRTALDHLIDEERQAHRGDPERESRAWMEKLAEVDRLRARFQDMAAEGLITFDELRAKLAGLEETRDIARRELGALRVRSDRLAELEDDKATLLETCSEKVSKGLDYFTPEDRHQAYKKLRLAVLVHPGGDLEVTGVLGHAFPFVRNGATSRSIGRRRRREASAFGLQPFAGA